MPDRGVGVADTPNADGIAEVMTVESPSTTIRTTTTADPGSGGTSLAVTSRSLFPQSGNFKVRVNAELMLVTAGHGTGAGSFTVTRGIDGTTAVAHATGSVVAQVMAVQAVYNIDAGRIVTYRGRFNTFRTAARVATSQNIAAIHNATGSAVKVRVTKAWVDKVQSAAAGVAPTVIAPSVRLWKVTVLPTNGTALTKIPQDSGLSSSASVTIFGDASADGTGSGTTLTATLPAGTFYAQAFTPRMLVVGTSASTFTELFDRHTFLEGDDYITLNALEGLVVNLSAPANMVATDWYLVGMEWEEYTVT